MSKRIAYLITSNDVDGRGPTVIEQAFWDEQDRDTAFNGKPENVRCYLGKREQIVDEEPTKKAALAKLNGLDRLLLGLGQSPSK